MKILLINKYLFPKGGDAISTLNTGKLLTTKGHKVIFWGMDHPLNPPYPYEDNFVSYIDYNNPRRSILKQTKMASNLMYSVEAKKKLEKIIKSEKPDIVHLNNFAHQISPSILHIFKKYNIPMVMTCHDYKLVCASYSMLLDGKVCEACKGGRYYNCFFRRCVKDSRTKSLLNTIEMYLHHKILHIYDLVDVFVSPSRFLKTKLEEMGFKCRIKYLPNFVRTNKFRPQYEASENSIVYFGRLSKEKGLYTLLEAVKGLDAKLKIIGEGLLKEALERRVEDKGIKNVEFLGYRTGEDLKDEIRKSMFVVLPSECYENNPRSIIEGFALGKPAIGARIGGIPELVKNNETGLTFEPGNVKDLQSKIKYLIDNSNKIIEIGKNARRFVEKELNAEKHYQSLMKIYEDVLR